MSIEELKKIVGENKSGGFTWAIVKQNPPEVLELYYLNSKGSVTKLDLSKHDTENL